MQEFEKMTYAGKYPEKLHELMARWSLSEFETALKVVQTYYTNTRAPQKIIHAFETYYYELYTSTLFRRYAVFVERGHCNLHTLFFFSRYSADNHRYISHPVFASRVSAVLQNMYLYQ